MKAMAAAGAAFVVVVLVCAGIATSYTSEGRFISECRAKNGLPTRFPDGTTMCFAGTTMMRFPTYAKRMGIQPGPDGNYVAVMHPNTAQTLFGELTPEQKQRWARDVWGRARDNAFLNRFMQVGLIEGVRIHIVASSIHHQDDRITVAPPNPVLALRQQLRMRAG